VQKFTYYHLLVHFYIFEDWEKSDYIPTIFIISLFAIDIYFDLIFIMRTPLGTISECYWRELSTNLHKVRKNIIKSRIKIILYLLILIIDVLNIRVNYFISFFLKVHHSNYSKKLFTWKAAYILNYKDFFKKKYLRSNNILEMFRSLTIIF
jgi:hypothetical protein